MFDVDVQFVQLLLVWCVEGSLGVEVEVYQVYYYLYVVLWLYIGVYYVEWVEWYVVFVEEIGNDGVEGLFVWFQVIYVVWIEVEFGVVVL